MEAAKKQKLVERLEKSTALKFLYTRDEAALSLGLSTRTLDYLIARGDLETTRIGKKVLVKREVLRRYASGSHPEAVQR